MLEVRTEVFMRASPLSGTDVNPNWMCLACQQEMSNGNSLKPRFYTREMYLKSDQPLLFWMGRILPCQIVG